MSKRIVARRDSATTILRKMGINARDYDVFIKLVKVTEGGADHFEVDVPLAESHLKGLQQQTAASKPAKKFIKLSEKKEPVATSHEVQKTTTKVVPASKKTIASPFPIEALTKGKIMVDERAGVATIPMARKLGPVNWVLSGETITEVCNKLILDGHSNTEIWEFIEKQFNLKYATHRGYPAWYRYQLRKQGHKV